MYIQTEPHHDPNLLALALALALALTLILILGLVTVLVNLDSNEL